jgi:ferric-dicitrate binding protein FerR (iron transport regulator)
MAHSNARRKLIRLIQKYLRGKASPDEEQFIEAYYESFDASGDQPTLVNDEEKALLAQEMKANIWQQIDKAEQGPQNAPVVKRLWFRYAMAAAVVVLVCIPVYYYTIKTPAPKQVVKTKEQPALPKNDAMPGGNKATLTLADGTVVDLDNAANGTIATEGKTIVKKKEDGQLEYQAAHSPVLSGAEATTDPSPSYNILSTPTGGQYFLELPDGSKVWLNAASSIRYPTAFNSKERLVELTGEAYFDIKKNQHIPFRVHFSSPSKDGEGREGVIEVMGTQFNVNAYHDEGTIKTTLLEGKVKIESENKHTAILLPGQQAQIKNTSIGNGHIRVVEDVDTEEAIAWKNGLFYFDNVDIQAIMRQLARWYKVQVVFKGKVPARRFAGQVSRNSNLSQVLRILELSKVHFTIEGDVVTVLP